MALKIVKGTLERVLDKNLQDLVRGIRNHKDNEVKVTNCIIITKSHVVIYQYR
jgi:AP-3 complex subunit delta-1